MPRKTTFILFLLGFTAFTYAQTPCSVEWAGNVTPTAGSLNNNFTAAGSISGKWVTTNPSFGSFNAGRPNYLSAYSTMIGTSRGGGFGARTTITFGAPVDFYRLRVWDLRGDGLTSEAQRIEAFNGGVSVTRMYSSDNPALVSINTSTNTINGSTSTSSASQGTVHISFAGPVDSLIVRSVGNSDFVVIELLCPDGLTDVALTPLKASLQNDGLAQLSWATLYENSNSHFEVERSETGVGFYTAGTVNGRGTRFALSEYRFTDPLPVRGSAYYRLKVVSLNGSYFYSSVVRVKTGEKPVCTAFFNTGTQSMEIYTAAGRSVNWQLFNMAGTRIANGHTTGYRNMVPLPQLATGIYYLRTDDGETMKIFVRKS